MKRETERGNRRFPWAVALLLGLAALPLAGPASDHAGGQTDARDDGFVAGAYKYSSEHASGNFESRELRWAEFTYSVISDARFRGADLRDADLRYCVASDADFTDADLRRARLSYTVLSDARFNGARLEGADLRYCLITSSTRFSAKTTYDASTRFPRGFDPAQAGLQLVAGASDEPDVSTPQRKPGEKPSAGLPPDGLPQRKFKAVLHPPASGLPHQGFYGDFTLSGPIRKSLVALPGPIGEVVSDASGRHLIGMGGHGLYRIDLTAQTATPIVARNVPEISWAMGITYDGRRDRVLLATLGGEGFLYAYQPQNDAWSVVTSLRNVDLTAIAYYEPLDRIFGIAQDRANGKAVLYEYDGARAEFVRSRLLEMPIAGSFIDRSLQLTAVDRHLVFVQVPETAEHAQPLIHVIDPKTATVRSPSADP